MFPFTTSDSSDRPIFYSTLSQTKRKEITLISIFIYSVNRNQIILTTTNNTSFFLNYPYYSMMKLFHKLPKFKKRLFKTFKNTLEKFLTTNYTTKLKIFLNMVIYMNMIPDSKLILGTTNKSLLLSLNLD